MRKIRGLLKLREEREEEPEGEPAMIIYPVWAQDCENPLAYLADARAYEECLARLMRVSYQLALHKKAVYLLGERLAARYFDLTMALQHGDYQKLARIVSRMGEDLKKIREVVMRGAGGPPA